MKKLTRYKLLIGLVLWLTFVALQHPEPMLQSWAEMLLVFAVLILTPIAITLFGHFLQNKSTWLQLSENWAFPAGVAFAFSYTLEQGGFAAILCVPWFMLSLFVALSGFSLLKNDFKNTISLAASMGALFFPVGTAWAILDRAGLQPFGYDAAIVLLTAVHFHFAGFFFPLILAAIGKASPSKLSKFAVWLFLIGVPLTAVGISLGHFYQNYFVEAISGSMVVVAVLLAAVCQMFYASQNVIANWQKVALLISSLFLGFAMLLAACYANRDWLMWDWCTIPNLRFWHGTANMVAVSLGLIAWGSINE